MKKTAYDTWIDTQLTAGNVEYRKKNIRIWTTEDTDKPIAVLVHGISGDHNGLVPLAVELAKTYRIVLVDMPGHGQSDAVRLGSVGALDGWCASLLSDIETTKGPISLVVAHSFGCMAMLDDDILHRYNVVFLNPAPTLTAMYRRYETFIRRTVTMWSFCYNWRPFVYMRGRSLRMIHTPDAKWRVRWVGRRSRANKAQIVYQGNLSRLALNHTTFAHVRDTVALVVCGMSDTTATQRDSVDMMHVFGSTPVLFLRGGHLLPIEAPARVAEVIVRMAEDV